MLRTGAQCFRVRGSASLCIRAEDWLVLDLRCVGSGLVCCVELGFMFMELGGIFSRLSHSERQTFHAIFPRKDD